MTNKVPFSAIQKLNAVAEIEYEVEVKAETDPKLKAMMNAQENAQKHLEKINQILDKVKHLIDGDVEYEIHREAKLKKPGKKAGAKNEVTFRNPHTNEELTTSWPRKGESIPEALVAWIETFGITEVAQWGVPEKE